MCWPCSAWSFFTGNPDRPVRQAAHRRPADHHRLRGGGSFDGVELAHFWGALICSASAGTSASLAPRRWSPDLPARRKRGKAQALTISSSSARWPSRPSPSGPSAQRVWLGARSMRLSSLVVLISLWRVVWLARRTCRNGRARCEFSLLFRHRQTHTRARPAAVFEVDPLRRRQRHSEAPGLRRWRCPAQPEPDQQMLLSTVARGEWRNADAAAFVVPCAALDDGAAGRVGWRSISRPRPAGSSRPEGWRRWGVGRPGWCRRGRRRG